MINLIVRSSYLQGDSFRPAFKLLDPFITAAGIGGVVNSILGSSSQKSANKTNMRIAQMNNEAMLQAQRENNEFNKQTAIDMFNLENEYNDPSAVAERLRAAGFNPAVAMGDGAPVATSGQADTPQMNGVPSFQQATVSPVPSPLAGVFDGIEKYASAMSQLAQAKKHDADVKIAFEKLQPELDGLWSDVALKQAQELYNNTQAILAQFRSPYEVRKLAADYTLAMSKNETEKAQKLLVQFEQKLTSAKEEQVRLQTPVLVANLKKQGDLIDEQKRTEQTKQSYNNAGAYNLRESGAYTHEQTSQLKEMHDDIVELQNIRKRGESLNLERESRTLEYQIDILRNQGRISDLEAGRMYQDLERAKKENDWFVFDKVLGGIESVTRSVGNVAPWAIGRSTTVENYDSNGYISRQNTYSRGR